MRFRRSGGWAVALAIAGIGAWAAWSVGWRVETLSPPLPSEKKTITAALGNQTTPMQKPTGEVLSWVLKLPRGPDEEGELLIGLQPSATLPRSDLVDIPSDVLGKPGRYLSVSDAGGRFVYIAWIGNPRILRGEHSVGGKLEVVLVEGTEGGVAAGKAPFVADGVLTVFELENGEVTRIYFRVPLTGKPFRARGKRFKVPFS